ncbi:MAG TPA: TetR/AcrR family transcriptional regulator [Brachybacterium faecium]|nr:TetR/AcrR family transcriptional regulator [Brachybacterium faecium]
MPTPPKTPRPRVRRTPEERIAQIVEAATDLVSRHGFYGLSLQEVADAVGLTQPGLLHYVRNKDGLLQLLVDQRFDRRFDPEDFIATGDPAAVHPDGVSLPAYFRYLVHHNAQDPHLIRLHMVLSAESTFPDHPAHEHYAARPSEVWSLYSGTRWRLPPQVGTFEDVHDLVELALAAMDGMQIRMFRDPPLDLETQWARAEKVLFPSPIWDGFR